MPDLKTAVTGNTLPRHLGLFGLWLLVVNGLIGAGIFGLPGGAAKLAGEYSPLIYLFCALLILPILLCMAELASYFRGSGGPVRYGTAAFGPFIGFQAGWLYYIARLVSFAANSVLLVDSIGYFWPAAIAGFNRVMLLAAIIVSLTLINVVGSLRAMRSLALLTVIKFAVLLLLVVAGASLLGTKLLPDFNPLTVFNSPYDIGAATLLLIYAFVGFESVVVPAGEAKNPARDMPRALILGLLLVTLLYIGIQLVSVAAVTDIANSSSPLLDVAAALFGPAGAMVLMLGVVASVAANLLGAIFSTPRASFALAEDGSLPRWFGAVQPHFLTPANSIMFFGVLALVLALYGSFMAGCGDGGITFIIIRAYLRCCARAAAQTGCQQQFCAATGLYHSAAGPCCLWLAGAAGQFIVGDRDSTFCITRHGAIFSGPLASRPRKLINPENNLQVVNLRI